MESLDDDDNKNLFSEDSKETKLEWFKNFLETLPKIVEFGEIATKDKDINGIKSQDFSGKNVDEERLEKYEKAKAIAKEKKISFVDALEQI